MCRETVSEIGGKNWKGLPADSSEVVRWSDMELKLKLQVISETKTQTL